MSSLCSRDCLNKNMKDDVKDKEWEKGTNILYVYVSRKVRYYGENKINCSQSGNPERFVYLIGHLELFTGFPLSFMTQLASVVQKLVCCFKIHCEQPKELGV